MATAPEDWAHHTSKAIIDAANPQSMGSINLPMMLRQLQARVEALEKQVAALQAAKAP